MSDLLDGLAGVDVDLLVDLVAERVAERVVERLGAVRPPLADADPERLVDAAALARRLGVDRGWVYRHARELGAVRLGSGPRAPLRFPQDATPAAAPTPAAAGAQRATTPRRHRRAGSRPPGVLKPRPTEAFAAQLASLR